MREAVRQQRVGLTAPNGRSDKFLLMPSLLMMGGAVVCFLLLTFSSWQWLIKAERPYLIPWVLAAGVVFAAPMIYLKYRNEFSFVNPLVLATISYFFPVFFIGGWSLTLGLSNYFYLSYVSDPEYNFPLAFVYIMLGHAGLSIGYLIPKGKSIGNWAATWLPKWDFTPTEIVVASIFFLIVGFGFNIIALEVGQIGYQMGGVIYGDTGALTFFLTTVLPATSFLMWVAFFLMEKWNIRHLIIIVAEIGAAVFMLVIGGGKSSLLMSALLAIGAFVLVRRKVLFKHWVIFAMGLFLALIVGTIYGTKFRDLKGGNDRVSVEKYSSVAFESLGSFGDAELAVQLEDSFLLLANRLETVSALAVVVSNYEALSTYEAAYGLENNIWTYTWTAFIPRFLWKDKPLIADGFSYNELYFDNGSFGLSLTAMGDLLRNFGPIGVPLGMILLGFALRIFYASLVEGLPLSAWRMTVYFVVLTRIGYDGFYGEIFPAAIRMSAVIFAQFLVFRVVVQLLRRVRN